VGEVVKGCPGKWVQWEQRMQGFTCGCLCRRRAAPVLDANLSKPMPLFFYSFILYCFFFKRLIRGHCPGVVTSGDSVTHKYFCRNEKVGS
jgi:hypothetical protein